MTEEHSELTRKIAGFVASLANTPPPAQATTVARLGITDSLGVLIAGYRQPAPVIVGSTLVAPVGAPTAPAIPDGRLLAVADAAYLNGVAGHVLDYDDVALAGHPSVAIVPAIMAQGWAQGSRGDALLAAYVAGYETWAVLAELEPGAYHDIGFHPTAVMGSLAAASACAYLRKLDAQATTHALAIAASLASGLVANFGTMTKSLHAGRAAQNGVQAARLASLGFTASPDALEHRTGFMRAHSPSRTPKLDANLADLGCYWRIARHGLHIKRYPICYATHRAIDGMLEIKTKHSLQASQITQIHVETGEFQALMLRNHFPTTGLEAKFSMQFAMASAVVAGQVGLAQLTDSFVAREEVRQLMKAVRVSTTPEMVADWDQPFAPEDKVSVQLSNGERLMGTPVARPLGSWQRPMGKDELRAKFIDCTSDALGDDQANRLFEQLWGIENIGNVRDLAVLAAAQK